MTPALVRLDVKDDVATLTLDDAARKNALTEAMGDALQEAVARVRARNDVRAVVVVGAGDSFSAGGDLAMLQHLTTLSFDEARLHMLAFYRRYLSLLDLEVPTLAAVKGAAIGAGACVAAACDVVVAAVDCKIAFNFVALGLHPGMGATHLLPRKVGAQRAADLLFTGRRIDGVEAERIGFAAFAVASDDVVSKAESVAAAIAKNGAAAVRALKQNLGVDRALLQAALEREATAQAHSYASPEFRERIAALLRR